MDGLVQILSCEETGRQFQTASATVARWEKELSADPDKKSIGTLVRLAPGAYQLCRVPPQEVLTLFTGVPEDQCVAGVLAPGGELSLGVPAQSKPLASGSSTKTN